MTSVFIKRGNLDIDGLTGRTPCEDEGRDQGDNATSQGTPMIASKLPKAGEKSMEQILPHSIQGET